MQERKGESYIEKKKNSINIFTRAAETHRFSRGTVTRSHPEGVEHISAQRTNPVRRTEMVHFNLNYAKLSFPIIMIIFAASPILDKLVRFPPCWKTHMRHYWRLDTVTLPKFCEL